MIGTLIFAAAILLIWILHGGKDDAYKTSLKHLKEPTVPPKAQPQAKVGKPRQSHKRVATSPAKRRTS
jgi:hypothetical protein